MDTSTSTLGLKQQRINTTSIETTEETNLAEAPHPESSA
jgi:hypothetical protein